MLVFTSAVSEPHQTGWETRTLRRQHKPTMKTSVITLLAVLGVGAAAWFGYRFAANEMAWRVEKATRLGELAQAEHNRRTAETFRHYPTEPGAEWATTHLETDINRTAEIEVIDAKQRLLSLYKDRGRTLSTEEATQAARWEQDRAAWNAREAASVRP